ncbi:MAG: PorV/PorQ family protein [Elusimicrobiota bacterium]
MMRPTAGRSALALMLSACLILPARGADFSTQSIGSAGSEFLTVDVDARAIAMGGAYTAATDNAYAMYWNPAGLSQISRASLAAMHNEYVAGIRYQYLSYAQRIGDHSVLGGAFRYMDAGSIPHTNMSGVQNGEFRPRDLVFEVGLGQNIPDLTDAERDISLGVTGRYFHSTMVEKASGVSADFGIQAHYTETYAPYNFGFVVQNVGRGQKFDRIRDSLPTQFKLGVSIRPRPPVLLSLDSVLPIANQPYLAFGSEYGLEARDDMKLFFRFGVTLRTLVNDLQGVRGLRFGLGAKMQNFTFDYAWAPLGRLGNTHKFSIGWNLPQKRSRSYRRR